MRHCTCILLALAFAAPLSAQAPLFGHGDGPVDASTRRAVIDTVLARLEAQYVFPDVARRMEKTVRARVAAGAYDRLTTGAAFAAALSADLYGVAHDKHLGVYYYDSGLPAPGAGKSRAAIMAEMRRAEERANFGFEEARILSGNVGYVKLTGFMLPDWGGDAAAAALHFVGKSDALILDLRGNHGGSPEMVQLVASYLLPARTHLNDIYTRPDSSTHQFWTLPSVAGGRYPADRPVYVLVDHNTISAGEELTYDLQTQKRGIVVGEVTAGAANPGGLDRVNEHFAMFLPRGRAINPVTGTNWEGVGVKPDVPALPERALDVAHLAALKALLPHLADEDEVANVRREIERLERATAESR